MTSQPGKQTIPIHILPNTSRSNGSKTKFSQLIKYSNIRKIFFFKNLSENEAGRLASHLFLFFKKDLYQVKASGLWINLIMFR